MAVFAVGIIRRMLELRGRSLPKWTTHYVQLPVQHHTAEWLGPRPGRDVPIAFNC